MTTNKRNHADDLRAATKLVVMATTSITDVVHDMHRTIASGPALLGSPLAKPARILTALAYAPTRIITGAVGMAIDKVLAKLGPFLGESVAGPQREAVLAALNGVVGDYLAETNNAFAIPMSFRRQGLTLSLTKAELHAAIPGATGKVLVLVHGSSMNDLQWEREGHDHGAALALECGQTAVYLNYNSGLHISTNGKQFAGLLEELLRAWPVPVEELNIVGHSMGGLVARSACQVAEQNSMAWRRTLKRLVTLGTPHHGSPLEVGGSFLHAILGVSAYSAPIARLARLRSAGVTDLRFGYVADEHWKDRERFDLGGDERTPVPLPRDVDCYAIAASTAKEMSNKLPGDGLVPVTSALGRHTRTDMALGFPESHQWIALRTDHLHLLCNKEVCAQLTGWFSG